MLENAAVHDMYDAVGGARQFLVVGNDDEGLAHLFAQFEEEVVEFLFVVAV